MDVDYVYDIAHLTNIPTQVESLLHSLLQTAGGIGFHVNTDKMEYMCFNQKRAICTLNSDSLKLMNKLNHQSIIWKSDLYDKIKWNFFHAVVVSVLQYRCTIQMLNKHIKKKLDGNCTRMLRAISNKSWQQHPLKQQPYSDLLPISKTIQVRWTRHVGHIPWEYLGYELFCQSSCMHVYGHACIVYAQ